MSLDGKHLKRKLELDIPKAMGESISHTFSSTGCRAPKKRQAMVYSRCFRHTGLFCKGKDWVLDAYSGFLLQTSWITRKNKKKSTEIRLYLQLHNVLFENTDFAVTDMQPDHLEDSKQDLTGITYHHHKINTKHWDNYSNSNCQLCVMKIHVLKWGGNRDQSVQDIPYDSRTPITSWESKASPSLSAWTSFIALSWSLFFIFENMDSFHVSSMSCVSGRKKSCQKGTLRPKSVQKKYTKPEAEIKQSVRWFSGYIQAVQLPRNLTLLLWTCYTSIIQLTF